MFEGLVEWVKDVIENLGYSGIVLIVTLENLFPPIPSEVVLPFAGFLSGEGRFDYWLVVLAATAGSVLGAWILYGVGRFAGEQWVRDMLLRWGRYVLMSAHDLERADRWFADHGRPTVFFARLVPGVRSLVSIPAGFARQPLVEFTTYTLLGSATWNVILVGAGHLLAENWDSVEGIVQPVSYVAYAALALAILYFAYRLYRRRPSRPSDDVVRR
ncbi:MAG TPA: DedA family protein [Dehalococcoidia bacterium]|nr:DedA family protein [Dehalococcoidia bacterium]